MKNVVKYLAILLFPAFGLSSCNPIDEGQLPPSNTSNLTTDEALQLLQGTWYLDRVEFLKGPSCAGGQNEIFNHFTSDLMYPGYRMEFTDLVGDYLIGDIGGNSYQVYTDGENSTRLYKVVNGMTGTCDGCENVIETLLYGYGSYTENDLYLIHNGLTNAGVTLFPNGSKIRVLNDQELILELSSSNAFMVNGEGAGGGTRLIYFKRNNVSSLPRNQFNLHGVYKLDHYKSVSSGILVSEEVIVDGPSIEFTDQIFASAAEQRVKYIGQITFNNSQSLTQGELNFSMSVGGDDLGVFYFETTNTHLCTSNNMQALNMRIQVLDPNEILLYSQLTCNDYKEYHLTKVN
jgi:hypothetical protein